MLENVASTPHIFAACRDVAVSPSAIICVFDLVLRHIHLFKYCLAEAKTALLHTYSSCEGCIDESYFPLSLECLIRLTVNEYCCHWLAQPVTMATLAC